MNNTINLTTLLKITTFILPTLILFILIINSFLYNNFLQIIILLIGMSILIIVISILKLIFKEVRDKKSNPLCHLNPKLPDFINNLIVINDKKIMNNFYQELTNYTFPSFNVSFISFIATYLIYPMIKNNNYNYFVLVFSLISVIITFINEYFNLCSSAMGIIFGLIIGIITSLIFIIIIQNLESETRKFTYFSKLPKNNNLCRVIGNTFICNNYSKSNGSKLNDNNYTQFSDLNNFKDSSIYKLPCTYNYNIPESSNHPSKECNHFLLPLRNINKCNKLSQLMGCGNCLTDNSENEVDVSENKFFPDIYRNKDINNGSGSGYNTRITKCSAQSDFSINLIEIPGFVGSKNIYLLEGNRTLNSGNVINAGNIFPDKKICNIVSKTLGCEGIDNTYTCMDKLPDTIPAAYLSNQSKEIIKNNYGILKCSNFKNKVKDISLNIYSFNKQVPGRGNRLLRSIN